MVRMVGLLTPCTGVQCGDWCRAHHVGGQTKICTSLNNTRWHWPPNWRIQDYSDDDVRWVWSISGFVPPFTSVDTGSNPTMGQTLAYWFGFQSLPDCLGFAKLWFPTPTYKSYISCQVFKKKSLEKSGTTQQIWDSNQGHSGSNRVF